MSEIIPGLFLGGISDSENDNFLKQNNIKAIVNCAREVSPNKKFLADKNNIYLYIQADDEINFNLYDFFEQTADFIDQALNQNKGILIHCFYGVSRSASIVIAYLIIKKKMTCWKAKYIVQKQRPEVSPNDGFWNQLQLLFKKLNPEYIKN